MGETFEINLFTKSNYETYGNKFPENTYYFDSETEAINCLTKLLQNSISGIYFIEIIDYRKDI